MTTCYVCTAHGSDSLNPDAVACCSTCGVFACIWDGARLHGKGAYECAFCMVRVLVKSADVTGPSDGPGGGGIGAASEAHFREFLATSDFERDCERLAARSGQQREAWRELLLQQLPATTRVEFAARLADLAGRRKEFALQVDAGLAAGTLDRSLLADAAGVGEYAYGLSSTGPRTLASVSDKVAAQEAEWQLHSEKEQSAATPERAPTTYIGQGQQQKPAEKLKEMAAGGTDH